MNYVPERGNLPDILVHPGTQTSEGSGTPRSHVHSGAWSLHDSTCQVREGLAHKITARHATVESNGLHAQRSVLGDDIGYACHTSGVLAVIVTETECCTYL